MEDGSLAGGGLHPLERYKVFPLESELNDLERNDG